MRKSVFSIYMMYQDGEIKEACQEIEEYGIEFWTDLKFFLLDHIEDDLKKFFTLQGIILAYMYRKAR